MTQSPGENTEWISHSSFYVAGGETPGLTEASVSDADIRRRYWPWWRRMFSWPLIGFIRLWRLVISPLYGQVCSYYPSCSAYGLEAVSVHGLVRGSALTGWRILRCHPFTTGGVDHVPKSSRIWPRAEVPHIVITNHPPMDADFQPTEQQEDPAGDR